MVNHTPHPATDAWLASERRRLAPEMALAMVGRRITRRAPAPMPSPAQALVDIANALAANVECGDFALCFEHVREDMAALPGALRAIADEIGGVK